jgi:hypothetical protein
VTLTVANCRQDAVLVFLVESGGDPTFAYKVEAGECADLPTQVGQRWVAASVKSPYPVVYHTATRDKPIWLLRPTGPTFGAPLPPSGAYPMFTTPSR